MKKPYIVVVRDNVVESVTPSTLETCELDFSKRIQSEIPSQEWDEITPEWMDRITENGYYEFSNGSVCLTWIDV